MQRPREPATLEFRHEGEGDRREALHVGDASTVEPVALQRRDERIGRPRLAVDRHDVGVAGQDDAVVRRIAVAGGEGAEQVGLGPLVVPGHRRRRTVTFEERADPFDQRKVRVTAHGRVSDETADHLESTDVLWIDRRPG